MTALEQKKTTTGRPKAPTNLKGYYSVEFSLGNPRPLYQFKIWKSKSNPMFMLVKEDSSILSKLKTGCVLNMTYYSPDTRQNMETRIGPINGEQEGRFHGHYTVDLLPVCHPGMPN